MVYEYTLRTEKSNFYNITSIVREAVSKSGIINGVCVVYCPHTTAGITINENADPDVVHDLLLGLDKAFLTGENFFMSKEIHQLILKPVVWEPAKQL